MIPSPLIPVLAGAADAALAPVLLNGAAAFGQNPPTGEVGFVAAVVLGGVPAIANAWRPILRPAGYQLRISGVFCHQSPQATFTDNNGVRKSCELADLLVVVDDLTGSGSGRRWATLVQAKMASPGGGKTLTQTMDLRQLDLFTRWPAFTLPLGYQPYLRDFSTCRHAGMPFDCGRYGLIDTRFNPEWRQQVPARSMPAGGHRFGSFLAQMVGQGQTGFGREATGNADDWSRTVDELMTVTYAALFTYVAGFGSGNPQSRGHMACAYMAPNLPWNPWQPTERYTAGGNPPPSGGRPDPTDREDRDPLGISVLRLGITQDRDEGEFR